MAVNIAVKRDMLGIEILLLLKSFFIAELLS